MTRPYAEVIGDPIAHSKSPLIHNFWLEKLGIDAEYRACHVRPDELADYFASRREDPAWRGCNVTLPHKVAVMNHADDPGGVRASIGAMNMVARGDAGLFGTNTDAGGFLMPIMDMPLAGADAIVVGSGGAALAVLFALKKAAIGRVTVMARNPLKAAGLLARFGLKGQALPLDAPLTSAALLVNASALGMAGHPDFAPDLAPLPEDALVYDIVYAPLQTALLKAAEERGLETADGLSMLTGQAALAFEIFFEQPPREGDDAELRALLVR
jgi:shikimate dehydrogenase